MPEGTETPDAAATPGTEGSWTDAAERELRELERRAYGRGPGLDDVQARRLRTLHDARRASASASGVSGPGASGPASASAFARHESAASGPREAAPEAAAGHNVDPSSEGDAVPKPHGTAAEDAPSLPLARRRRASIVVAAALALVAVGVGAGWALFAPRDAALPLTAAQEQRRAELAAEDYDQGSVRAVAQSDDALAWFATQDDARRLCLVLDVGDRSQSTCLPADDAADGMNVTVPVPIDPPGDEGGAAVENVVATLLLSVDDEPMVSIQRWSMNSSVLSQFEGEQRTRAEELLADGYELGLSLVGFFHGEPVWLADRPSDTGVSLRCLIVDADASRQCAPISEALESGLGVQVVDVDQESGDVIAVSVVQVEFTRWQAPYLSVTTGAVFSEAPSGDSYLVTTGPPGDPIRVEIPDRDPDG
ncbi:hypothetical protein ACFV3I_06160 [Microbacterium sp. NPDC059771]|uniref:hypothetical protein n=2 Tax=Microbacterium TaxID=33882 RepID=UPI00364F9669